MKGIIRTAAVAMLMFGFGQAIAAEPSLADIREQQQELRGKLERDDRALAGLSDAERGQLRSAQQRVFSILDRHDAAEDMHPAERMRLTNELEVVSALVEGAGKDRMVCKRVKKTGSHRHVRECKTVAEREHEREEARKFGTRGSPCTPELGCTGR